MFEKENQDNLESKLLQAIADPSIEILSNAGELVLDSLLTNELLKKIPGISLALDISKAGIAINDYLFTKKLLRFLQAMVAHSDDEFQEKYKLKVLADQSQHRRVAEHLIEIINRIAHLEQVEIIANLFDAFVIDKLTWDEFQTLSFMLSQTPLITIGCLDEFSKCETPFSTHNRPTWEGLLLGFGFADRHGSHLTVNKYGRMLHGYGIKPYIDKKANQ